MANPANQYANLRAVVDYLVAAYESVDVETAKALVEKHRETVDTATKNRSYAYFPGDKIAAEEGLVEREDFDPDADDDDDSGEW